MRTCKKCSITDPPRGFYSPHDGACRSCRDARRKQQWNERYSSDPEFKERADKRSRSHAKGKRQKQYEALLEVQQEACAICNRPPAPGKHLVIDHDHACCAGHRRKSCGKCIRGLLCDNCNLALGLFQDDIDRLISAAKYLSATQSPI